MIPGWSKFGMFRPLDLSATYLIVPARLCLYSSNTVHMFSHIKRMREKTYRFVAWSADVAEAQRQATDTQTAQSLDCNPWKCLGTGTDRRHSSRSGRRSVCECVCGRMRPRLTKGAQWTYDPSKSHLQTYLSLSPLFHCHRFPWQPG